LELVSETNGKSKKTLKSSKN